MNVQFIDLKKINKEYENNYLKSFKHCLNNSMFIKGKFNLLLEKKIEHLFRIKNCLLVNSGTDALIIGIKALSLEQNSEIIVTSNTWISSAYAIAINNLMPVFVDINKNNFQMDIADFRKKISKKTKAVLVTHLYGYPNNMDEIITICKKRKILIIEDVAQAHLAKYKNKYVGSFGNISILSFYPSKNLGALGDGGAILSNSKKLIKKCRMLANYGSISFKDKNHKIIGFNSRMDEIQASFLLHKLPHLKRDNAKRRKLAKIYHEFCIKLNIQTIEVNKNFKNVYHLFPILVNKRNFVLKKLLKKRIFAQIHYEVPIHLQKSFKYLKYKKGSLPTTENISKRIISLPFYPDITLKKVRYIFLSLQKILNFKN
jgi:dTDP-4-amino-4,6-dideoxygalactose transaminase